jgi:hypothetical protein
MKTTLIFMFIAASGLLFSCRQVSQRGTAETQQAVVSAPGPRTIIYRTHGDYFDKVPVILSSDKSTLLSFPAPADLKYQGRPALPTELAGGFLLDNRGIDENVAFISMGYEEYIALEKTPDAAEIMGMIIDSDPLEVMYDCGLKQQYANDLESLNSLILEEDFSRFKKLK